MSEPKWCPSLDAIIKVYCDMHDDPRDGDVATRARAELTALRQRAEDLEAMLRKFVKECVCCGTGEWTADCTLCGDSTYDHECNANVFACKSVACLAARAALLTPEAREAMRKA